MAVIYYVALPFIRTDDGTAPGEAQECQSEAAAIRRAEGMSSDPANVGRSHSSAPTFGSPARLNATAPALAGSFDIPSARLIAAASLWHSCASPGAVPSSVRMNGRAT